MIKTPKILITGASGFTGQHACSHFLSAGYNVTSVTRKTPLDHEIAAEFCDLTDKVSVRELIRKIKPDYLLHLAGQNHVGESWADPISSFETNTLSTMYLIEALRQENPTCKIVIVGSALQFDPHQITTIKHPYSLSKTVQILIAQSWQILYEMNIIIAKPTNLIGPGKSSGVCSIFAKNIVDMEKNKSEKILEVNNLHAQRDFVDIRDAVRAYEILLTSGESGKIYDIASGNSYSLEDIIIEYKGLTTIDFQVKLRVKGLKEEKVVIKPVDIMNLGWTPYIPLKSSLEDILNYYRSTKVNV